jgi:FMN phosphatase YigB (HAD superfamily)
LEQEVRREHEAARAAGVDCPEVCWTETMATALPELRRLTPTARDAFLDEQAQIWHQVSWMPGAVDALRALRREEGVVLGVASNAQPYTVRELARQLAVVGLSFDLFEPELCFWSFAHGFSKPNPHVFRILQARLRARGIAPGRTWMVGDRLDNDIDPARACGWRVWPLSDNGPSAFGGDWAEFLAHWRRA